MIPRLRPALRALGFLANAALPATVVTTFFYTTTPTSAVLSAHDEGLNLHFTPGAGIILGVFIIVMVILIATHNPGGKE